MKNFILIALFFSATFSAQQMTEYGFGVPYTISYPAGYMKTYDLNDYAASQFTNAVHGKHSVIIDVEKDNLTFAKVNFVNIKEAGQYYTDMINGGLIEDQYFKNSKVKEILINGLQAAEVSIEGTMQDEEDKEISVQLFYLLTLVESKDHYFQILSWCNLKDKNKNLEEFRKISQTFKIRK
ncbi:hypothetical protein [Chryseobacterium sp. MP_3.2]|uniref:hypothetical protein n=1 Tax=Chryseobacterium sp. MP_3.2 TaxID=3071712 RepID=UPI002DFCFB75|nr:hypothetical protein [Chryseobacterium sp. MP_3.2]